jgi:hypothetical protein
MMLSPLYFDLIFLRVILKQHAKPELRLQSLGMPAQILVSVPG